MVVDGREGILVKRILPNTGTGQESVIWEYQNVNYFQKLKLKVQKVCYGPLTSFFKFIKPLVLITLQPNSKTNPLETSVCVAHFAPGVQTSPSIYYTRIPPNTEIMFVPVKMAKQNQHLN